MPTYEYRCNACNHEFERFQSMKDSPLRTCPACGKKALQRLIGTGAAVIFKGSGFYQTDYRSETYKKAAEADAKAGTPSAEPKPDAKTEPKAGDKAPAPDVKPGSETPSKSRPMRTGSIAKPVPAKRPPGKPKRARK